MCAKIDVRSYGRQGCDVVVVHGGPGAQGSVASLAAALAPRYTVCEPLQRRGGGRVPLTVEQHVEDLAAVAPQCAVVVGWSWGAMLALSFAAAHPDRVSSLVLVGCGAYDEAGREAYHVRLERALGAEGLKRYEDLRNRMEGAKDPEWQDDLLRQLGELVEHATAVDPIGTTGADVHPDAAGYLETWSDVMRLQSEGVEPLMFARIECPVLMLHGDEDPHPGRMIRDTLQRYIPHLAYIGFEECAHVPWLEARARDRFMDTLEEWIDDSAE